MKAHHAAAFSAANLSAMMDDTDKVRPLHEDALANGLVIVPPDINASEYRFVPVDAKTVRYGLGAVRGTGESAIAAVLEARKTGGWSRRWSAQVLLIQLILKEQGFLPRSVARWRRRSRPSARRRRTACSARPRRRAAARMSWSRRPPGT
jgi:hypothetical protein